jgi:hypothetical protein
VRKTPRTSGFQFKYGVAGAGAVSKSLIGRLPAKTIGPVSAVSYRVASRIANTLSGGYAVRSMDELIGAPAVLFHSSPDQMAALLESLEAAGINWEGKPLVFCDCRIDRCTMARFRDKGASVALARQFEIPGFLIVEGAVPALHTAHRLATELRLKAIEIVDGMAGVFEAAVTLGTTALTPLIDSAATFLRQAGVRESDAPRLAAALVQRTALEYAHSGKQSWGWYLRQPDTDEIEAQIRSAGILPGAVLRHLLVYGFELYGKHPEASAALNKGNRHKSPA